MSDPDKDFYPAYRFHPTRGMQLVPTRADDEALKASDAAWVNTPADLQAPRDPPAPPPSPSPYAGDQTAPPDAAPPAPALGPDPEPAPKRTHHKKKAA